MILKKLSVGQMASNCYIVGCSRTHQGIVIDPGADPDRIQSAVEAANLEIDLIVLTHFHFDHIEAVEPLQSATGAELAIHAAEADHLADPPSLFRLFNPSTPALKAYRLPHDDELLNVGDLEIQILHTPGHSPGGISLYIAEEKVVFTGDALFREGVGRTDFPGSDPTALVTSIRTKLYSLPDETVVHPGHGPETPIGWEKRHNPFVRPENGSLR